MNEINESKLTSQSATAMQTVINRLGNFESAISEKVREIVDSTNREHNMFLSASLVE